MRKWKILALELRVKEEKSGNNLEDQYLYVLFPYTGAENRESITIYLSNQKENFVDLDVGAYIKKLLEIREIKPLFFSLFSKEEVVSRLEKRLMEDRNINNLFSREEIIDRLEKAIKEGYITFDNKKYKIYEKKLYTLFL